tara:strand:+ start:2422 stop:3639 length:1218 start_codon:yes stop_codon:yes gene_type:complete
MAYYPKNKAKIKPSKEGEFIYQDNGEPFKGNYIQTSKNEYYEGEDINLPGRSIIPTQNRQQKNLLLSLLKNLLLQALTELAKKLLSDLLANLLSKLLNPGDIFNAQQAQNILNDANGRDLTENELNNLKDILNQIDSEEVELKNSVIANSIYNNLKPNIYISLNQTQTLTSTKIKPTDKDYINGNYTRYFSKKYDLDNYFEIDESTYNSLSQKKSTFDSNLYQVFSIKWSLGKDAQEINTNVISRYERSLPGIQSLFNDPTEYTQTIKNNLYTEGNELYFKNGNEYIGEYHIHPIKGPMVGPVHIKESHSNLYYSYELGTSKNNPSIQNDILEDQQYGLFKTIGSNEYYIKENRFGIYVEVLDTLADPNTVIYTSETFPRITTTPQELVNLAEKELKQITPPSST